MSKLKGVILSVEDILVRSGEIDPIIFAEVTKLINFFRAKSIEFVVTTNRSWTIGKSKPLENRLFEIWGEFRFFCRAKDRRIPPKPTAEATQYILNEMGWAKNETVYVGATENDMRTAVNGNLLFLRATWWADHIAYGFQFNSPKDIACFIDTLCLRDHLWCHEIKDGNFEFYALAPFSTMRPEYTLYSEDARAAAKFGTGHPDFWLSALVTSLYFSGVYERIDYITVYPGHRAGSGSHVMDVPMSIFGKCFRTNYIPDLIIRHTTALKSQTARNSGQQLSHLNQLNTINLNRNPSRSPTVKYKNSPLGRNKTVLLVDDICTNGYSLEAARAYIQQTGAKVIMAAWLKTINTDIHELAKTASFDPYKPTRFILSPIRKSHSYRENLVDHMAPTELTRSFNSYTNWNWPQ